MTKCDECQFMARFTVTGYIAYRYLCALHASLLCESVGDQAGSDRFALLVVGDQVSAL